MWKACWTAPSRFVPSLTAAESQRLIADGIATGGMQAKLNAALAALPAVWSRCASPPARPTERAGAILEGEEIGTRMVLGGASSMISGFMRMLLWNRRAQARGLTVRKAGMRDIPLILDLINSYAAKGIMLPRTEFEMSEAIRDFTVVNAGDRIARLRRACIFIVPTLGEIRSLAVYEQAKTKGVGRVLVEALVEEAQEYELDAVFAFTYVVEFFNRVGFHAGGARRPAA